MSKNRSIWSSRGARLGPQTMVFGGPYELRKWSLFGPYIFVAHVGVLGVPKGKHTVKSLLLLETNMDRSAETAHTRAQDGARSGSRQLFLGVQVDVQKEVMLGPYKSDVGEAKSANKDPILGVDFGTQNESNLSHPNSPMLREFT